MISKFQTTTANNYKLGIIIVFLIYIIIGCKEGDPGENTSKSTKNSDKKAIDESEKNLNISIFLDLSNRIDPSKHKLVPSQRERDLKNISTIVELFKKDIREKGGFGAQQKIRVLFNPTPSDPEINQIAGDLSYDLTNFKKKPEKKKEIYDEILGVYQSNIDRIYNLSIDDNYYPGSDIYRFFNNSSLKDYCIADPSIYRNILIIFTDGYIYHKDSQLENENKTSYITPSWIRKKGLRNQSNWREVIEDNNYGLIAPRKDLSDLDVMVIGIQPYNPSNTIDEDILKYVLTNWFNNMNVDDVKIISNDLPSNTKMSIETFF